MTAVVAVLLAVAVSVLGMPRRRVRPRGAGPRRRLTPPPMPRRRDPIDVGVLLTEVAARLRAGADVESAWGRTLERVGLAHRPGERLVGDDGVPHTLLDLASGSPAAARWTVHGGRRPVRAAEGALPGAIVACRLTHEIGAPLADVLDRCATGIAEAGHARTARAVALAGPRSTARLLGWLPLLGLALGAAVGADPVAVLLDGGLGTLCLILGTAFVAAGRWWVAALDRAAQHAGEPPRRRGSAR